MKSQKKYPMNGPTMQEQQAMYYYWMNPGKAKELIRKYANLNR